MESAKIDALMERVREVGEDLNAVTSLTEARARRLGSDSRSSSPWSHSSRRLEGVSLAVKDVIDVAGSVTTMGSQVHDPNPASQTASVVEALEVAGAMTVTKTNCQEYSYGILGDESAFGRTLNPRDRRRITGGSSSGSAALVAAGAVDLAVGTDTAGSTRVPAAYCEVLGFKPTLGMVATDGIFPLAPSFDTVGLFSSSFEVMRYALQTLLRQETSNAQDRHITSQSPLRIDVQLFDEAAAPLPQAVDSALRIAPDTATGPKATGLRSLFDRARELFPIIRDYEAAEIHRDNLVTSEERYQPGVRAKLRTGSEVDVSAYQQARHDLEILRQDALAVWDDLDFLIIPSVAGPELRWSDLPSANAAEDSVRYTQPISTLGWPAITVPFGQGVYSSVQIVAKPETDLDLLEFAGNFFARRDCCRTM